VDNRRLLAAALLSAIVLIVWNLLFPPVKPPVQEEPVVEESGAADSTDARPVEVAETEVAPGELPRAEEEPPPPEPPAPVIDFADDLVVAEMETSAVIETGEVRIEFSNRGAQLHSFLLKKYATEEGKAVNLVRRRGADLYPFSLVLEGGRPHPLNDALFEWEEESDELGNTVLRFRHRSELGAAEKVFRWTSRGLLAVEITMPGESGWGVLLGPGVRNPAGKEADSRFSRRMASYRRGEQADTFDPNKQKEDVFLPASGLRWVGLEDNFFLIAAMPLGGLREALIRPVAQRAEIDPNYPRFLPIAAAEDEEDLGRELLVLLWAGGERLEAVTFLGAKEYRRLEALPYGLEETVRWGAWLRYLALPLYYGLAWIHENIVPNYGWSIVLITFLIKLLFFPLTHKSQESMGRMQELNPKVQAIRNKYRPKLKDSQGRPNPEAQRKMNEEVMAVYKEAGVNPVSGCFPMLLQMPVFFAFYQVLIRAVELRNAPWILWIQDLASADPIYILPLLMGGTSIAMQKMMPSSPDPMQRRMMQMMPIVFTVFALAFPSGLVLYWVTNNLLTMAQQAVLLKWKKRRAGAESKSNGDGEAPAEKAKPSKSTSRRPQGK